MPDLPPAVPAIPFYDARRDYAALRGEIDAAMAAVLRRGRFILGEEGSALEAEFAGYCGAAWAVGVGNGTEAIQLILEASGIGPGDEVITSPLTAAFTALAISRAGATPVFADVEPEGLTLDPAAVRASITPRTAAILPVHLYGQMADMAALQQLAEQHHLRLIEDACQAHGARFEGRRAGSLGHAAAFSFYPTKNLGAYGDGGMAVTSDAELARRLRALRHGGQTAHYRHDLVGANSRLDELQAAILRAKLPFLESWNARRAQIAARYSAGLRTFEAPASSTGRSLRLPVELPGRAHAWHLYVVRSPARGALREALARQGVGAEVHYPAPVHLQPAYASLGLLPGSFRHAEAAAEQVLSLPLHPFLDDGEVRAVIDATARWLREDED
ncbi:MAG TPA: DegT/DnrJ/EryC1/StrS family aminotransferase [Anaerolineae bacterium]|nr:DegT/DnrJ/EryC1/StrS family aminotransferase [Anaerolineae bacterium]